MHGPLPEATQSTTVNHCRHICTTCERPTVVGRSTNQSHACLNFSRLHSRSPTLHSVHDIDLCEIFECAHLKFTVSGRSIAIYTHTCAMQSCGESLAMRLDTTYVPVPGRNQNIIPLHISVMLLSLKCRSAELPFICAMSMHDYLTHLCNTYEPRP